MFSQPVPSPLTATQPAMKKEHDDDAPWAPPRKKARLPMPVGTSAAVPKAKTKQEDFVHDIQCAFCL